MMPPLPRHSRITGTGSFLPPNRVSNAQLAARLAADGIETSDEWIVERTGIRFRHFAEPTVTCSDLAAEAARRALAAADCDPQAIDLIIVARPSLLLSATLPTKPSQTTMSVVPLKMSLPSTLPK